jgi:hypothetical protein
MVDLNDMAQKAAQVAELNERNAGAARELFDAQCGVVRALLESIRQALPFLCAQIPKSINRGSMGFSRVRGLRIVSGKIGKTSYSCDFFMKEDGELLRVGSLPEQSKLAIDQVVPIEIEPATIADLVSATDPRDFALLMEHIAAELDRALEVQLRGKLEKRTVEFQDMAADLRALARLAAQRVHKDPHEP